MADSRVLSLVFCISLVCYCCFFFTTQARHHEHSKHKHGHEHNPVAQISLPPCPPPEPAANQTNNSTTSVFDVRSFGAIGNGIADDTEAFKAAWDTACQAEESSVVFVPYGYFFMIQSTIFTGPCHSPLVFQVI